MMGWKVAGFRCSVIGMMVMAWVTTADAQQSENTKRPARQNQRAEFQPPEVQADLPHVLLIGDSISIGYMLPVRKALSGVANVWRPPTNCGPTTRGLESLESWLGDRKWDVIHFNFGLHDLKYVGAKGQNLADPSAEGSHQQVPLDQYTENLRQIAKRLKATGATVIWCETTPVPQGAAGRVPGDEVKYNQAAAEVMQQIGGIEINPLHAQGLEHAELQQPANVHYTPEGSEMLARQVARQIRAALAERQSQ